MSEAKHTPGPWTRDRYGHVIAPNGEDVRFRSLTIAAAGSEERIAEAEANTTLAAAAPDLLGALQELRQAMRYRAAILTSGSDDKIDHADRCVWDAEDKADAAISAATGSAK